MIRAVSIALILLSSVSAQATVWSFRASLNGAQEHPPNASPGTGFARLDFNDVSQVMEVAVVFSGLLGTTTAVHIHCCISPSDPNPIAAVATPNYTAYGFPLGVTSGSFGPYYFDMTDPSSYSSAFLTAHGGLAGAEAFLVDHLITGEAYFDIHTTVFPGGEIRGFLSALIFKDGFESTDSSAWSLTVP